GEERIGEVIYFTQLGVQVNQVWRYESVALIQLFLHPNATLFQCSFHTVVACKKGGIEDCVAVNVKDILGVVAMTP
ncbi:hypothetical protein BDN67DRAFT_910623, partial [Paxillus ammoniavirescens]